MFNVDLCLWKDWCKYVATDMIMFGFSLDISNFISVGYSKYM